MAVLRLGSKCSSARMCGGLRFLAETRLAMNPYPPFKNGFCFYIKKMSILCYYRMNSAFNNRFQVEYYS
jgi:hypothetical protein